MSSSLKHKAAKGFFWSLLEKTSILGGQFIIGIVLARQLSPNDFGIVAMLSFFIAISYVLIDGGLGRSLIQKHNCTEADFSTVFVFNSVVSVVIYIVIFICAPCIAEFYNTPELISVVRVLAFSLVLQAMAIVQNAKLTILVDFKQIAQINIYSVLGGGTIAIIATWYGLGVWALVIQTIIRSLIYLLLHWLIGSWKISFRFYLSSFTNLFRFGSNLLFASFISEISGNIYNLIIGKYYLTSELGEFNRSKSFTNLASNSTSQAIQQVSFPLFSSIQNDKPRIEEALKKVIKMSAFFSFPILTLLSILAEPVVRILLTEKWLLVVPLLKWMAFSRIFYSINATNLNILNAIGRSDLFLKVDIFKFTYIVIIMIITIPMGVKAMVIGQVINGLLSFYVNSYLPGKYFNYGTLKQIKDLIPIALATLFMATVVLIFISIVKSIYINLFVGIIISIIVYYVACKFLHIDELKDIEQIISKKIRN